MHEATCAIQVKASRAPRGRISGDGDYGSSRKEPGLVLLGVVDELDEFLSGKCWANADQRKLEKGDTHRRHALVRRLTHTTFLATRHVTSNEPTSNCQKVERADLDREDRRDTAKRRDIGGQVSLSSSLSSSRSRSSRAGTPFAKAAEHCQQRAHVSN
eukprot:CAMPEP_0119299550 /NCGR_PEP_ID=MMETSP1333-20130426/1628_1 /TAXON_ID=418940 /ORGANISM="Scyphosphaera apsteinii, Strain RCC1455" /LENGTH=157 /DNA_ID=CAMNT_0007301013 /DNA_START=380 /DNA_END=853 /DNA_ORIENTATION=-